MVLVLLVLFVIALTITCAGWFLSPRSHLSKSSVSVLPTYPETDDVLPVKNRRASSGVRLRGPRVNTIDLPLVVADSRPLAARSEDAGIRRRTQEQPLSEGGRPARRVVSLQAPEVLLEQAEDRQTGSPVARYAATTTDALRYQSVALADGVATVRRRNVRLHRPVVEEEPRVVPLVVVKQPGLALRLQRLAAHYSSKYISSERPVPWLGLVLIFGALFCVGLISLQSLFPSVTILQPSWVTVASAAGSSTSKQASTTQTTKTETLSTFLTTTAQASSKLVRLYQLDPTQYASNDEFDTWSASACSAASMTEVINSYGHSYHITNILKVESGLKQITPDLGLLSPSGIGVTVAKFGFTATYLSSPSLDDVIAVGNKGHPVIVSFPPTHWTGGHILIVRGGNANSVYLADSSQYNMTVVSRSTFSYYWGGFAVVVAPT